MAGIGDPPANSERDDATRGEADATRIVPSRPSGTMPPVAASGHGGSLLRPGQLLANTYEIEALIGRGGMGEVYRARHVDVRSLHAIKVILPNLTDDPQIVGMFTEEARKLRMVRHDAVVAYDGMARDEAGLRYLVMEFVDGVALSKIMRERKLTPIEVRHLRDRLAQGLAAAHDKLIFHRDISPDNILLVEGKVEQAKIIDFGIAKAAGADERTVVGTGFAGKYSYVSPEQLGEYGGEVDARTDIYSLGLMLAAAAIGKPLDMGHTPADALAARRKIPDLSAMPAELRDEIAPLLEPDPANRPRSMRDLPGSFIGADTMGSERPRAAAAPIKRPPAAATAKAARRRSIAPLVAVAAIIVVVVAGGGYFLLAPAPSPGPQSDTAAITAAPSAATPSLPEAAAKPIETVTPSLPSVSKPIEPATAVVTPPPPPTSDRPPTADAAAPANQAPAPAIKPVALDAAAPAPIAPPRADANPPTATLIFPEISRPADANPPTSTLITPEISQSQVAVLPPPRPSAGPTDRNALLAGIAAATSGFPCAVLKPVLSDTLDLRIMGFVSSANDQARINQALSHVPDLHGVATDVAVYNWPQCKAALDTLRQSGAIAAGAGSLRLGFNKPVLDYREGDPFIVETTASASFDSYLYVDLLDNTGRAYHLHAGTLPLAAGKSLRIGTENSKAKNYMDIAPPFGPALVLAIAAARPLFARPRPADEDSSAYLAALGDALHDSGGRAVAAYRLINTAPR